MENLQVTQSNQNQLIKVKSAQSFIGVFRTQLKILTFVPWIAKKAPTKMFNWVLKIYTSEVDNKDSRGTCFMLFLCFYCWLWTNFVHWFSCIFDIFHKLIFHCFGQVSTIWERFLILKKNRSHNTLLKCLSRKSFGIKNVLQITEMFQE